MGMPMSCLEIFIFVGSRINFQILRVCFCQIQLSNHFLPE